MKSIFIFLIFLTTSCGGGGGDIDTRDVSGEWALNLTRQEATRPDCGSRVPAVPTSITVQQAGLEFRDSVVVALDNGETYDGRVELGGFVAGRTVRTIQNCENINGIINTGEEIVALIMRSSDGEVAEVTYNYLNQCSLDDECQTIFRGTAVRIIN